MSQHTAFMHEISLMEEEFYSSIHDSEESDDSELPPDEHSSVDLSVRGIGKDL